MARSASFVCQSCGNATTKWSGRCDACGEWNSIVEEAPLSEGPGSQPFGAGFALRMLMTSEARMQPVKR